MIHSSFTAACAKLDSKGDPNLVVAMDMAGKLSLVDPHPPAGGFRIASHLVNANLERAYQTYQRKLDDEIRDMVMAVPDNKSLHGRKLHPLTEQLLSQVLAGEKKQTSAIVGERSWCQLKPEHAQRLQQLVQWAGYLSKQARGLGMERALELVSTIVQGEGGQAAMRFDPFESLPREVANAQQRAQYVRMATDMVAETSSSALVPSPGPKSAAESVTSPGRMPPGERTPQSVRADAKDIATGEEDQPGALVESDFLHTPSSRAQTVASPRVETSTPAKGVAPARPLAGLSPALSVEACIKEVKVLLKRADALMSDTVATRLAQEVWAQSRRMNAPPIEVLQMCAISGFDVCKLVMQGQHQAAQSLLTSQNTAMALAALDGRAAELQPLGYPASGNPTDPNETAWAQIGRFVGTNSDTTQPVPPLIAGSEVRRLSPEHRLSMMLALQARVKSQGGESTPALRVLHQQHLTLARSFALQEIIPASDQRRHAHYETYVQAEQARLEARWASMSPAEREAAATEVVKRHAQIYSYAAYALEVVQGSAQRPSAQDERRVIAIGAQAELWSTPRAMLKSLTNMGLQRYTVTLQMDLIANKLPADDDRHVLAKLLMGEGEPTAWDYDPVLRQSMGVAPASTIYPISRAHLRYHQDVLRREGEAMSVERKFAKS